METLSSKSKSVAAYRPFSNAYTFYLSILIGDQSIENNTTPVYVYIYAHGNSGFNYNGYGDIPKIKASLYDSKTKTSREIINESVPIIPVNTKRLIGSWEDNLEHDDNGNLKISVSISYRANTSVEYMPQNLDLSSGEITLSTIARKSEVACASFNVGENTVITIGRKNNSFTHTITYQFGNLSGTIATKTSQASLVWNYNYNSFYNEMPKLKSLQGKIFCKTYSGSTLVGESECKFTATIIDLPEITSIAIEDINTKTNKLTVSPNNIIKFESTAKITITASPPTGTTIKNYRIVCGGIDKTQTSNVFSLDNIEKTNFSIYVTDQRGNTKTTSKNITLIPYIKLDFLNTETKFTRLSPTSTKVRLSVNGYFFNGNFGLIDNTLTLKYRFKERRTNTWSDYETINNTELTLKNGLFNLSKEINSSFDYLKTYEFELVASDKIKTITLCNTANMTVLTGERIMSKYKDRVDFKRITIGNQLEVLGFHVIREIPD